MDDIDIPSPQELREQTSAKEKEAVNRAVAHILAALGDFHTGGVTIDLCAFEDRILSRALDKFRAKGWNIRPPDPFTPGSVLVFSEAAAGMNAAQGSDWKEVTLPVLKGLLFGALCGATHRKSCAAALEEVVAVAMTIDLIGGHKDPRVSDFLTAVRLYEREAMGIGSDDIEWAAKEASRDRAHAAMLKAGQDVCK